MVVELLQITAVVYLASGAVAAAGLALRHRTSLRSAVALLIGAVGLHALSFSLLHTADPTPPLTDTPTAISFMAWVGAAAFLLLLLRFRIAGLVALVAPVAFVSVFYAVLRLPHAQPAEVGAGSVPHAHVLLASAGLALLGLAGIAGVLFLTEHGRLKRKRPLFRGTSLPSLEALDRVNAFALATGLPLLTLGVVTGGLWTFDLKGTLYSGTPHETWCLVAWAIYAVLAVLRFGARLGARRCAVSAAVGFVFAGFAVVGVEWLA
ncbi:MAG: cytochrome c biogenesis protein CcsA [Myxococcota bacterium]